MRIDFHCHIFDEMITLEVYKQFYKRFEGYGFHERILANLEGIESIQSHDIIEKTLYHVKKAKIDKVVLLPVSYKENEIVKKWFLKSPELFIPFFNPPEKSYKKDEIYSLVEPILKKGIYKGFKIMLSFRNKKFNDEMLYPTLELAEKYNFPVLFHSGYPPPGTPKSVLTYSNPILIDEFINSFPKVKVIIAHMGYPWVDNALALAVQYTNVYLDVSNLTYMMPSRLGEFLIHAKELIGLDKILFGSDGFIPEMIEVAANFFEEIDFLSSNDIEKIMGKNAEKILNI
ncbi:MAG: amidohydrolase [Promethearchaeota archaeon]|nr:MAG: amidohydrolase [Candidatus Lokiarchaeota archaeon]